MKVESLRPYQKKVNVTIKAVKVNESREVTSKLDDSKHSVTEALVGDDTGTVLLTLWDDDISNVQPGQSYDVVNGFTSLFKQSLRLNVGRYGELKAAEVPIETINEENNLSGSEGESPTPAPAPVEDTAPSEETASVEETVAEEASATEEATTQETAEKPATETSAAEAEPVTEEPVAEKATEEPVAEEAPGEEATEKPVEEAPAEEKKPKEEKEESE